MTSPFIHPAAICESPFVGEGTRVWAFVHILPGARIGADCNICDGVFVENDVIVGDRVTVKSGVQLWDGVRLADGVFVGPNVTFTNDPFPRSRRPPKAFAVTVVEAGASIGANATILPGVRIGTHAMVGAGSVVTRDVPPNAIVYGNPAVLRGYLTDDGPVPSRATAPRKDAMVGGAGVFDVTRAADARGQLAAIEFASDLPFVPVRLFTVFGVPSARIRGEHAHKVCHQALICLAGSVSVVVDDGRTREEIVLSSPSVGLHIPPMMWASQYRFSADAVLAVLASHPYDPDDYIRDYQQFLDEVG